MKNVELVTVAGRGKVLCVEYETGDYFYKVGDRIYFDGTVWEVRGVELSKLLTDPPTISHYVVLQVSPYLGV